MTTGFVSAATDQGKRSYQEDRHVVYRYDMPDEKGWLTAVVDGHSGSAEVAEFCEKNLSIYFTNLLNSVLEHTDEILENILKNTISALHEATKEMDSGATISIVYISETRAKAFVAILGDSPVIIKTKSGVWVGPEHNARTNLAERKTAVQRGAVYSGGYIWDDPQSDMGIGLQLTRSLGDKRLAKFLNREPETFSIDLDEYSFIIVASDGLIDPGHSTENKGITRLLNTVTEGGTAFDLVKDALHRRTGDNVTVILWKQSKSD